MDKVHGFTSLAVIKAMTTGLDRLNREGMDPMYPGEDSVFQFTMTRSGYWGIRIYHPSGGSLQAEGQVEVIPLESEDEDGVPIKING